MKWFYDIYIDYRLHEHDSFKLNITSNNYTYKFDISPNKRKCDFLILISNFYLATTC